MLRYPKRMTREQFFPVAYRMMFMSRAMEEKFKELYRQGTVKGTVIISIGNEATTVGMSIPFRPGKDILALLHRDLGAHLVAGAKPFNLFCQYMANVESPTGGREGNVHHGDVDNRRLPFMSHLGAMFAPAVGATWAARRNGEAVFGLSVMGDGSSSTGDFHESINLASVQKVPVLFFIENNHYAFSTPTKFQYNCEHLSDRAKGYGIQGKTIDGTDVWEVYNAVTDALDSMSANSLPYIIESMTLRLEGHAVYDSGEYVTAQERELWATREPLVRCRACFKEVCGVSDEEITALETKIVKRLLRPRTRRLRATVRTRRPMTGTITVGGLYLK